MPLNPTEKIIYTGTYEDLLGQIDLALKGKREKAQRLLGEAEELEDLKKLVTDNAGGNAATRALQLFFRWRLQGYKA